ncbi:MAG: hypothetical protein U0Z26_03740 [Anaerolineales bacterium]
MSTEEQRQIYELKSRINQLEAQVNFLYKHLNVTFVEETNPNDDPEVIKALRETNLMEAIKVYRLRHNAGLAEAKAAVEEMQARLGL